MAIHYEFLQAKHPCTVTHHAILNVFSREDISLEVNNNTQIKLPLAFRILGGLVSLSTLGERLVPVKEVYMVNSNDNGLVVTLYNISYSCYDRKAGGNTLILRYVE